jgi:molecular chaperone DnaK (HSP70)
MDLVLQEASRKGVDGRADARFMAELKKKAEQAKKDVAPEGGRPSTWIALTGRTARGDTVDLEVELTRREFENQIRGIVDETIEHTHRALRDARLTPAEVDHVLLVGGSTTVELVQRRLREEFGEEKILRHIDPMQCVAIGVAILAARDKTLYGPECDHENDLEALLLKRGQCPYDLRQNDRWATVCSACGRELPR